MKTVENRVYFSYHNFNNSVQPHPYSGKPHTRVWGDPHIKENEKAKFSAFNGQFRLVENMSPLPAKVSQVVHIQISVSPPIPQKNVRVASSLEQLLILLRLDGIGVNFSGTFAIEEVSHTAQPPGQQLAPSQLQVLLLAPGKPRLPLNAPQKTRELESALLKRGFQHSSYVPV